MGAEAVLCPEQAADSPSSAAEPSMGPESSGTRCSGTTTNSGTSCRLDAKRSAESPCLNASAQSIHDADHQRL